MPPNTCTPQQEEDEESSDLKNHRQQSGRTFKFKTSKFTEKIQVELFYFKHENL
jgi:hypothetical protein